MKWGNKKQKRNEIEAITFLKKSVLEPHVKSKIMHKESALKNYSKKKDFYFSIGLKPPVLDKKHHLENTTITLLRTLLRRYKVKF